MKKVQQLLDEKGTQVWSIGPDASLTEALGLMAEMNIGALLVIDDTGPVGLISERDFARNVTLAGKTPETTRVHEIMTHQVVCVTPDQPLEEAMALMTERRVRHLPVLDDGQVLGMISIGDLVKSIISEQQFLIDQLVHYING
jgi:CBS domain-containing protein